MDLPMAWDENSVKQGRRKVNFDPDGQANRGAQTLRGRLIDSLVRDCQLLCVSHGELMGADQPKGEAEVVVMGCRIDNPLPQVPHSEEPEIPRLYFLRMDPYLHRWTLNLETKAVSEQSSTMSGRSFHE